MIKLLIIEPGSDQMQQESFQADAIAVCRITWAEAMAGVARRQREQPNDAEVLEQARQQLIQSWPQAQAIRIPVAAGGFVMTSTPAATSEMEHLDELGAKSFDGYLVRSPDR